MAYFVSYSRAQFHLAEDLALALGQRGVDAWFDVHRLGPGDDWEAEITAALHACDGVLLVASRDALASVHVRAELDLARRLGKRIVLALAERVAVPADLAGEPGIDLRRRFEAKVRLLATGLQDGIDTADFGRVRWSSRRRPAAVRIVSGMLLMAVPFLGLLSLLSLESSMEVGALASIGYALASPGAAWLWWTFSRRRRGWTAMLGAAFGVSALGLLGVEVTAATWLAAGAEREGTELAIMGMPGVLVIVIGICVARTGSFYRWLPTGDAPRWMRGRAHARRGHRRGGDLQPVSAAITYDISCGAADASVQSALDRALQAHGHRRDQASAERQIVILGNLTPAGWFAETLARLDERPVIVISSPVSPAALEHLERYQWIDHRRRRRGTLERLAAAIGGPTTLVRADLVPESLERRVKPVAVHLLGGWYVMCGATMLSVGIAIAAGAEVAAMYGASQFPLLSLTTMLTGLGASTAGVMLAVRRASLRPFLAVAAVAYLSTCATVLLLYPQTPLGFKLPAFVLTPLVLLGFRRTIVGWLPAHRANTRGPVLAAGGGAWWKGRASAGFVLSIVAMTLAWLLATPTVAPEGTSFASAGEAAAGDAPIGDETAIRTVLARYEHAWRDRDYSALCRQLDSSFVRTAQLEHGSCETAVAEVLDELRAPALDVVSVEVSGDRASARVQSSDGVQAPVSVIFELVREAGVWRLVG